MGLLGQVILVSKGLNGDQMILNNGESNRRDNFRKNGVCVLARAYREYGM